MARIEWWRRVVLDATEPPGALGDELAQLEQAVVRGVMSVPGADRADRGLADLRRRHEVGFADPQGDDALRRRDEVEELPDTARMDRLGGSRFSCELLDGTLFRILEGAVRRMIEGGERS